MEETLVPVSRSWLESLSTDELIKLADRYGIDIPPELERIFIVEEILEIANTEGQENSDIIEINPNYSDTVLLPKQYNISYVEVLIRDPLWVFVFWEIKQHERDIHENADNFNGYCLRIIKLDKNGNEIKSGENSFTVPVNAEDCGRYLGFAGQTLNEEISDNTAAENNKSGFFKIKLSVIRGDSELQIAVSAPFNMPRLSENENIALLSRSVLLRLSGVQDLSVIRNTDRQPKVKRQQ